MRVARLHGKNDLPQLILPPGQPGEAYDGEAVTRREGANGGVEARPESGGAFGFVPVQRGAAVGLELGMLACKRRRISPRAAVADLTWRGRNRLTVIRRET